MPSVSHSSLIGVAISCSGNILISLALTIQKLAHKRLSEGTQGVGVDDREEHDDGGDAESTAADSINDEIQSLVKNNSIKVIPIKLDGNGKPLSLTNGKALNPALLSPRSSLAPLEEENHPAKPSETEDAPSANDQFSHPGKVHFKTTSSFNGQSDAAQEEQRRGSHTDSDRSHGSGNGKVEEGDYLKSRLWWLGLLLISVGEGGNFLSYAFAPASVVAPLGTVALIANCLFAPLILKERFMPKELIGMFLAIVGAVTVVYASEGSNPELDPPTLLHLIAQPVFLIYTGINLLAILILIPLSRSSWGSRIIGIDVGICALFGGYTVLSTKAMASLLSTKFVAAFRYPITWVLLVVLAGTSVVQVKYLNKALMRFQSKEVIPTQFVFFSLAAIVGSAVLYQEFIDATLSQGINFAFGICTTFLGVYLLTSLSPASPPSSPTSSPSNSPRHRTSSIPSISPRFPIRPLTVRVNTTSSLQSSRSVPINENTPLLVPITPSPNNRHGDENTVIMGVSPTIKGFRLLKRASLGDLTPSLGNQAGFLLLATTPPATAALNRVRSANRTITTSSDEVNRAERGERGERRERGEDTPLRSSVDLLSPTKTNRALSPNEDQGGRQRRASDMSPRRQD